MGSCVVMVDSLQSTTPKSPLETQAVALNSKAVKFEAKRIKLSQSSAKTQVIVSKESGITLASESESTLLIASNKFHFTTKEERKNLDLREQLQQANKRKNNEISNNKREWVFSAMIKAINTFDEIVLDFSNIKDDYSSIPNEFKNKEEYCLYFLQALYKNMLLHIKEEMAKIDSDSIISVKLIGGQDIEESKTKSVLIGPMYIKANEKVSDKARKSISIGDLWVLCSGRTPLYFAKSNWFSFSAQQMLSLTILGIKLSSVETRSIDHAFMAINLNSYITTFDALLKFKSSEETPLIGNLCKLLHIKCNEIGERLKEENGGFLSVKECLLMCDRIHQKYILNTDQKM